MNPRAPQMNFSKGEIAPQLYGRFDVDAWQAGVKLARNVTVLKYGGLTKRPGQTLVAEVLDDSEEQRLIPFQFSLDQTYVLEFGQAYAAPIALGGRVLEQELAITAITSAANAQVTAAFHEYAAGDPIFLTGIAGAMGLRLNQRTWQVVAVIDENNFTINANTVGVTFTSATGGITRTEAPPPPPPPPTVPPAPDPIEPPPTTPPFGDGGGGGGGGGWPGTEIP
jgi:hypothetical protein